MELEDLIRDPVWVADVIRKAGVLRSFSAGKVVVEINMKDGAWKAGGTTVTFPRLDNSTLSGGRSDDPVPDSRKGRQ